jgi:hypothetical protein
MAESELLKTVSKMASFDNNLTIGRQEKTRPISWFLNKTYKDEFVISFETVLIPGAKFYF